MAPPPSPAPAAAAAAASASAASTAARPVAASQDASTAAAAPTIPTAQPVDDGADDELWRGIELEFNKEGPKATADETPDVQLEEQKDEE